MSNSRLMIAFSTMNAFHEIIADSFDNAEMQAYRRIVVDWHEFCVWNGNWEDQAFATMWRTGAFDSLEARCEEMARQFVRGSS